MTRRMSAFTWFLIASTVFAVGNWIWQYPMGTASNEFTSLSQVFSYYHAYFYYGVIMLISGWFAWPIVQAWGGRHSIIGRSVALMWLGGALYGIAYIIYFLYSSCTLWPVGACASTPDTYPSISDWFYISAMIAIAISLLYVGAILGITGKQWIRYSWVLAVVLLILGYFDLPQVTCIGNACYGQGYLIDPEARPAVTALTTLYYVVDSAVIAIALVVTWTSRKAAGGSLFAPVALATLASLMIGIADVLYYGSEYIVWDYMWHLTDALYETYLIVIMWAIWKFGRVIDGMRPAV